MLVALPALVALSLSPQQENRAVFRVSTRAVRVDVFVGRNKRAVPGLRKEDFELLDDGKPQPITSVAVKELPLNVFLVLDTSQSVQGITLEMLRTAASSFLEALSEGDRCGLLTFSHHLDLRSGLTDDVGSIDEALENVSAEGGTSWHDALFVALELLEEVRDRPMVLLFTDGGDTYSWLGTEKMLPLVKRSNAVIYAIARGEPPNMPDLRSDAGRKSWVLARRTHGARTRLIRELTEESGGRLLEATSFEKLQELFLEILAEMKTRYILSYSPPEPVREGWHRLEVRVRERGVDVHARRGYTYEAER
ncbi:MAG TPA: VWA domain-containing protein [Vicinamibacteria bacterium]|nr:VWA domain-containing protein [Vicinamibacteria bacterium]